MEWFSGDLQVQWGLARPGEMCGFDNTAKWVEREYLKQLWKEVSGLCITGIHLVFAEVTRCLMVGLRVQSRQ